MEYPVRSLEELAAGSHERKGLRNLGAQVQEWGCTIGHETDSKDALLIWSKATELMSVDAAKAAAFLSLAFPAVIVSAAMRYKLLLPPPARTDPACEAQYPWLGQPYTGRSEGVSAMEDPGVPRRRLFGGRDTSSRFDCTDVVAVLGGSFNPIVSGHLAVRMKNMPRAHGLRRRIPAPVLAVLRVLLTGPLSFTISLVARLQHNYWLVMLRTKCGCCRAELGRTRPVCARPCGTATS